MKADRGGEGLGSQSLSEDQPLLVDGRVASPEAKALFFEIARCANVESHFGHQAAAGAPCRDVISTQSASSLREFQLPEPWCGDIETAPVLFVSSNPSIGEDSHSGWFGVDREIWDSHVNLFFDPRWSREGIYTVLSDGQRNANWVRYWAAARARAEELLGRRAEPGRDYALTEVVHCKSRRELGVSIAQPECVSRYLRRVVALSAARVIVVFGDIARRSFEDNFEISALKRLTGRSVIEGRERIVLSLPHPNARMKRNVREFVSGEELRDIQQFLSE